jgi:hypothetical protein
VIMILGVVVGIAAWAIGLYGLATTANAHVVPVPNRLTVFGAVAMMGTVTLLVTVFAHGTRAGDLD